MEELMMLLILGKKELSKQSGCSITRITNEIKEYDFDNIRFLQRYTQLIIKNLEKKYVEQIFL